MKQLNLLIIAVAIIFSASTTLATAPPHSRLYTLKGEALAGSRILATDATSTVPFNKRFDALASQQQNLVKARFDDLGKNDTPLFPVSGLQAVYKPIIKTNKHYGSDRALEATATIDIAGNVSNIAVHNNKNKRLVAYVERSLRSVKFEPAMCDGTACEMDSPIDITFH